MFWLQNNKIFLLPPPHRRRRYYTATRGITRRILLFINFLSENKSSFIYNSSLSPFFVETVVVRSKLSGRNYCWLSGLNEKLGGSYGVLGWEKVYKHHRVHKSIQGRHSMGPKMNAFSLGRRPSFLELCLPQFLSVISALGVAFPCTCM